MLTIDELEMAGPGAGAHPADGRFSFRRILVPVASPGESGPALAVAARICGMTGGVLRLVHVRTCDTPLPIAARVGWPPLPHPGGPGCPPVPGRARRL